jgi:hypothetical protein
LHGFSYHLEFGDRPLLGTSLFIGTRYGLARGESTIKERVKVERVKRHEHRSYLAMPNRRVLNNDIN